MRVNTNVFSYFVFTSLFVWFHLLYSQARQKFLILMNKIVCHSQLSIKFAWITAKCVIFEKTELW